MATVVEALLNLTKPTTDAIKSTVVTLLLDVCNRASTSLADDEAVEIDASSVRHHLVVNLLACKNPNDDATSSSSSSAVNSLLQRAHALVCVVDRVVSFRGPPMDLLQSGSGSAVPASSKIPDPQLVEAAWGVLCKELQAELPAIVAAVIESYTQKQSAQMILIVRKWLNDRSSIPDETARRTLSAAISSKKPTSSASTTAAVDAAPATGDGAAAAADDEAAGSAPQLTSADARKRIQLLKHLCEGLEGAPTGNSDVAALRNTLLEYGADTAAKTGGARRWGVGSGMELRALGAALAAHVTVTKKHEEDDDADGSGKTKKKDGNTNDDDAAAQQQDSIASRKAPDAILTEACDSIDDVQRALRKKREEAEREQQLKQQQQAAAAGQTSSSAGASNTSHHHHQQQTAHHQHAKKVSIPVPAYSSLVLDHSDASSKKPHADAPLGQRGPRAAPEIVTPFSIPSRMSQGGERASREWFPAYAAWAKAVSSTDLKWVSISRPHESDAMTMAAGGGADGGVAGEGGMVSNSRVMPEAGVAMFFG